MYSDSAYEGDYAEFLCGSFRLLNYMQAVHAFEVAIFFLCSAHTIDIFLYLDYHYYTQALSFKQNENHGIENADIIIIQAVICCHIKARDSTKYSLDYGFPN